MEACCTALTVSLLSQKLRRLIFMGGRNVKKKAQNTFKKVDVQSLKASGGVWEPEYYFH